MGKQIIDTFGSLLAKAPKSTFTIMILVSIFFYAGSAGLLPNQSGSMADNISSDVDQYIPEGTEEKRILDIVRENWATKIMIVLIKTGNAYDTECTVNITDRDVLEEISSVEGDEDYSGSNFARGDSGEEDWIEYVLSLSALIKEINSSTPRMINMLEEELSSELNSLLGMKIDMTRDDPMLEDRAKYSIPESQERVDQIIAQIPYDVLRGFCADSNEDGIWDTTYVLMGAIEETPDEDEREFIDEVMFTRRSASDDDLVQPYFTSGATPHHTVMVQTGLIAIMIDITDEANVQLMRTMPIAAGLVALVMLIAHRSPKVFIIAGVPLLCTVVWTFGIITLTGLELSPIIVAAMPMLIGLSVDYSLHVSNRITEFEEQGLTIAESIRRTFHTTGLAILISATTTMIGFAALFIAPLSPIRMLGLTLVIGIAAAFFLSLTMVPCLLLMFSYRKPELDVWERVARFPVKRRWPIIIGVLVVTMISLANLSTMTETEEDRQKIDSQGIGSLDAIIEFSEHWSEGSTMLLVIEPNDPAKAGLYQESGALNDTEFLDQIEWLEENITGIENEVDVEDVSAMTIVDLFKSITINLSWTTVEDQFTEPPLPFPLPMPIPDPLPGEVAEYHYSISYWDLIHLSDDEEFRTRTIRIFYSSLTQEARDMLMTPDYSMTLCMVKYPFVGQGVGNRIVEELNEDVDTANGLTWNDGHGKATMQSSHATGGAAITKTINSAIMDTQIKTLVLSMVFVFVTLAIVFLRGSTGNSFLLKFKQSSRYALLTMIPVVSVIAWQPLIMKGVSSFEGSASLNMMTAMISSVVIGAGIDFGVHITERIREEGETVEGIKRAVQHTGQSIMEANLTTVAGLTGGLFVVWFRGFFSVLLLLLIYSMFAGMILLPAVYTVLAKRREGKAGGDDGGITDDPHPHLILKGEPDEDFLFQETESDVEWELPEG